MRPERARSSARRNRARPLLGLWLALALSGCGHREQSKPEAAPAEGGNPALELRGVQAPAPVAPSIPQAEPVRPPSPSDAVRASEARRARAAAAPQKPARVPAAKAVQPKPSPPAGNDGNATEFDFAIEAPAPDARAKKSASPKALFEQLQKLKLATADCPSARDRTKAICGLASQICGLMERDPDVASTLEYCHNAKERCTDATRRTTERCGE